MGSGNRDASFILYCSAEHAKQTTQPKPLSKNDPAKLTKVSVRLPFGIGGAELEADPTERHAAWSLYVELVTRIALQTLEHDMGMSREALSSLKSLFGSTREILREAGPNVGCSRESVGGIAIAVLNRGLRPFLSKWHPLLETWENQRNPKISPREHESCWPRESELRSELNALRQDLEKYAGALATIAGV